MKKKLILATAVWVLVAMVIGIISICTQKINMVALASHTLTQVIMTACFVCLLIALDSDWRKPAILGIIGYAAGILLDIISYRMQNMSGNEAIVSASVASSGLNIISMVLLLFAYLKIAKLAGKGSLLHISALVLAWWPIAFFVVYVVINVILAFASSPEGMLSVIRVSSIISTTISSIVLTLVLLQLRDRLPEEDDEVDMIEAPEENNSTPAE